MAPTKFTFLLLPLLVTGCGDESLGTPVDLVACDKPSEECTVFVRFSNIARRLSDFPFVTG